jgi:hypothetical protein
MRGSLVVIGACVLLALLLLPPSLMSGKAQSIASNQFATLAVLPKIVESEWLGINPPYPPDSMGAVGPTQFLMVLNGRVRSFYKSGLNAGSPDHANILVKDARCDVSFRRRPSDQLDRLRTA